MKGWNPAGAFRVTLHALRLLAYPAAEVAFILLAWSLLARSLWASAACVLLAATAQSYSLHIVFHEVVHRRYFRRALPVLLSESAVTILLGSPFNEYRQSHWRHHRYTNLLEDSTSTWAPTPDGPSPRRLWSYSLGWPAITPRSMAGLAQERRAGRLSNGIIARMLYETFLLLVLHVALIYYAPALWVIYVATIYLGYVGIAAINYMQHPPVEYGTGYTTSIYSPRYNRIFYNNGLHFEHHARAQVPVIKLVPTPSSGVLYADPVGSGQSAGRRLSAY